MDTGPFADCPICARPPTEDAGADPAATPQPTPSPAYRLGVSMDAVTKLSHYAGCGQASQHVGPLVQQYFGPVDNQIHSLHASGMLNLAWTFRKDCEACRTDELLNCFRTR
ncbi:hypothetical protein Agub_g4208 [Astrephomene gubernaculifera]|uniref:Uncharacterized protein n=1 Tax=Astrephomene gubernaculifera TaxID=47775 RepID=A0AAD3HJ15_9CHLO|nr:hypothetical protein Agub_g4208 [Astrephomene gubernaculifera]